jgi:hypothetical protein
MTHLYAPTTAEITAVADAMTLAYAADTKRIEKAAQLIAAGHVSYISNGIGWSVKSQRKAAVTTDPADQEPEAYAVTSTSCGCYDFLNRVSAQGRCADQQIKVYAGCKHVWAVRLYIHIIAAKLDEAMKAPFSGIYGMEMSDANVFAIYDRASEIAICGAVYSIKSDTYRPQTGQDAADFARWLYAQPAEFFPGGMLEQILRNAPGDAVTLKTTVIYGAERSYTLTGYRYDGHVWVSLEDGDRQEFNKDGWAATLTACGWIQPGSPVKQTGLSYNYMLIRGTNAEEHYGLTAATQEYIVSRKIAKQFERDLEAGGSGINPIK